MANDGVGETVSGNLRHAKLSDVCEWVKRAWEEISDKIIIKSFKTCGISNSLNNEEFDIVDTDDNDDADSEDNDAVDSEDDNIIDNENDDTI